MGRRQGIRRLSVSVATLVLAGPAAACSSPPTAAPTQGGAINISSHNHAAAPAAAAPPLDLERAIGALPEAARHVLVLVGLYGFSHAEAAASLRIAEGTCKAQLHRARQLLSQALDLEAS